MRLFTATAALLFGMPLCGQLPETPAVLRPSGGQQLSLQAHGRGVQIYQCMKNDTAYSWTLQAPEATLLDKENKPIGRHFAGPAWEANDGSSIVGQVIASVPSPNPTAVPWLLLKVTRHAGRSGVFSNIAGVQRLHTEGGKAPASGCDASHEHSVTQAAYQADYYFYSGS